MLGGRIAWNVVTSLNDSEAANFGQREVLAHDLRYDRAEEFMEVVLGHWNTWQNGAIKDPESGIFAEPSKVQRLDFQEQWFRSRGPFTVPRSAQGRPFVGQQDSDALAPTPLIEGPGNPSNPILDEFPNGRTVHPSDWYGEGTWVAYQATARLQLGLRGEVLKDIDGFDTGLPQTLWDITAGFNFKLAEWLVGRFGYRHDESSRKPFPNGKPLAFFPCLGLCTCAATASTYHGMDTILATLMFIF